MRILHNKDEALKLFRERLAMHDDGEVFQSVMEILSEVRRGQDAAVRALIKRLDGLDMQEFRVSESAFELAEAQVDLTLKASIKLAAERIRSFYEKQPQGGFIVQEEGALLGQFVRPLERIAAYVPAGQAPLFSTLLMTVIPAQVAGVPEVVVASPSDKQGRVSAHVLVAARMLGVQEVYALGGAVAIAALAYGTESIPRVDKIVGPGSRYTMAAKKLVYGNVGIEALPGPTETLVLADDSADIHHVVADLLAQAEHDGAQPVLVTTSKRLLEELPEVMDAAISKLPTAASAQQSMRERAIAVLAESLSDSIELANAYAPEHLCILTRDPWSVVPHIRHVGGIFIGEHSMEALGDYIVGPSHVMPTGGTARFSSAINVRDFQKVIPFMHLDAATVARIGPHGARMARAEGLEAHARAIESRLPKD